MFRFYYFYFILYPQDQNLESRRCIRVAVLKVIANITLQVILLNTYTETCEWNNDEF